MRRSLCSDKFKFEITLKYHGIWIYSLKFMQWYNPNDKSRCIVYKARSDFFIYTKDLYGIHWNLYDGNNYSSRAFRNHPACLWKYYNHKSKERSTRPWSKSDIHTGIENEFTLSLCDLHCNNVTTIANSPVPICSVIFLVSLSFVCLASSASLYLNTFSF